LILKDLETSIQIDIYINMIVPIFESKLIYTYASLDIKFLKVCHFLLRIYNQYLKLNKINKENSNNDDEYGAETNNFIMSDY
jgi:hypothetical protein